MLHGEVDLTVEARFYPDVRQSPVPEAVLTRTLLTRGVEDGGTQLSDASVILDEMIADVTSKVCLASASKTFSCWCMSLNSERMSCVDDTSRLMLSLATGLGKIDGIAGLVHYALEDMVRRAREE